MADLLMNEDAAPKTLPVSRRRAEEIVAWRDKAVAAITESARLLNEAYAITGRAMALAQSACEGRTFYGGKHHSSSSAYKSLFNDHFNEAEAVESFRKDLDANVWSNLLEETGLGARMDREERQRFDQALADDVPPVTMENLRATFERLIADSDLIFKRGVARIFSDLDKRFKSHDGFKVGSRIVLDRLFDEHGHMSWGRYGACSLNEWSDAGECRILR